MSLKDSLLSSGHFAALFCQPASFTIMNLEIMFGFVKHFLAETSSPRLRGKSLLNHY